MFIKCHPSRRGGSDLLDLSDAKGKKWWETAPDGEQRHIYKEKGSDFSSLHHS